MVEFELYLINKELKITENGEMYVEMVFAEEVYKPNTKSIENKDEETIIIGKMSQVAVEMLKKALPISPQFITPFVRLYILLKYSDYEKLDKKPDVGDRVVICFEENKIVFK
jgi:hypothetical protein